MKRIVLLFALSIMVFPLVAHASAVRCDPTGVWFGGSNWKYVANIQPPNPDGSWQVTFETAFDTARFGTPHTTNFYGRMVRRGDREFELRMITMLELPASEAKGPPQFELDGLHSVLEFKGGCETFDHTIDGYWGFVPYTADKIPFVTPWDQDFAQGDQLHETYHRLKPLK